MNLNYFFRQITLIVFSGCLILYASSPTEFRDVPLPQKNFPVAVYDNEDMVLRYLRSIQDNFSSEGKLVPAMEDNSGQTFNNAVTAMAFILSGEKERAEKILDFYAERTDSSNQEINYQNFFCQGDSRGFFQNIDLNISYYPFISDRWMGDNAWLLIAYKYYENEYGFNEKPLYNLVAEYLKNLLMEFYIDDPSGHGGFVRHGWRWGPRNSPNPQNDYQLHETDSLGNPIGHEEGNIDAYAALKLCGELDKAEKIKEWIDYRMNVLQGNPGLPLDLYSWRSLAFCHEGLYYKLLVNVPENSPGFKKHITFNDREVTGFFSRDDISVDNIWLDGLGHMVCAFYSSDYPDKGNFYSAQLDSFLIQRLIGNSDCFAIPYTANTTGGYDWVDINKGFSSSCAWYIFAKHGFNPFTFERNFTTGIKEGNNQKINLNLQQNFPNPFNSSTTIRYTLSKTQTVQIIIFDILGNKVKTLYNGQAPFGKHEIKGDGKNDQGEIVNSGMYLYQIRTGLSSSAGKMVMSK